MKKSDILSHLESLKDAVSDDRKALLKTLQDAIAALEEQAVAVDTTVDTVVSDVTPILPTNAPVDTPAPAPVTASTKKLKATKDPGQAEQKTAELLGYGK